MAVNQELINHAFDLSVQFNLTLIFFLLLSFYAYLGLTKFQFLSTGLYSIEEMLKPIAKMLSYSWFAFLPLMLFFFYRGGFEPLYNVFIWVYGTTLFVLFLVMFIVVGAEKFLQFLGINITPKRHRQRFNDEKD